MNDIKIKTLIQNKKILKAFSVLCALVLWLFVISGRPIQVDVKVPIVYILPEDKDFLDQVATTMLIKVQGARAYVSRLSSGPIGLTINLGQSQYQNLDEIEYRIDANDLSLPFGVALIDFNPKVMKFRLDKKIYKKVPIKTVFLNKAEEGQRLIAQDLQTKEITIEGPKEEMRKVGFVATSPIDLSGLKGRGEVKVPLEKLDPRIKYKDGPNPFVVFTYDIRPKTSNLTISQIPIRFISSQQNFRSTVRFAMLKVLVANPGENVDWSPVVKVLADIPEGASGSTKIDLRAILPDSMHLLEIIPQSITVRVK